MSHTPGPWIWWQPDLAPELTNLGNEQDPTGKPVLDCAVHGQPSPDDAVLIAAAPNLLEAAKEVLDLLTYSNMGCRNPHWSEIGAYQGDCGNCTFCNFRNVIAKAEGK